MNIKRFPLVDGQHNGFFNYSREYNQKLFNSISLTSFDDYITDNYCYTGYSGHEIHSLIDGNIYTSWSNNKSIETNQQFIVDIGLNNEFQLIALDLHTVCSTPKILKIYGSQSNQSSDEYEEICSYNQTLDEYSYNTIQCYSSKYYRYYKFSQIGMNNDSFYRFHLSELELYGFFHYLSEHFICSHIIKFSIFSTHLYFLFLIYIK